MADNIHRAGINASPATVYDAVATVDGVEGWWSRETTGESRIGGVMTVRFRDHGAETEKGRMDLEVVKAEPREGGAVACPGRAASVKYDLRHQHTLSVQSRHFR